MSLSTRAYQHMKAPHHMARPAMADRVGHVGERDQGPFLTVYLRVADGTIQEASFETYTCPWATAAGSALARKVEGLPLETAATLTECDLEAELDGVPRNKRTCLTLAIRALKAALTDPSRQA